MTPQNRYAGTPSNHTKSARTAMRPKRIVSREAYQLPEQTQAEKQRDAFKAGLLVGITASAIVMALIMWLWVIPTMDSAVSTAQDAYNQTAATVHA